MKLKQLPPPDVLRRLLRYDPETGKLYWRARTVEFIGGDKASPAKKQANVDNWNKRFAGKEAFTAAENGYRSGAVQCVHCMAHRVAYSIYHGVEVDGEIDHINGDKADNRITNLRLVDHQQNARNMSLYSNNTSGHHGVIWDSSRKRWEAKINVGGKQRRLGRYFRKEEAIAVRKAAEVTHGYHPNHGRQQPSSIGG